MTTLDQKQRAWEKLLQEIQENPSIISERKDVQAELKEMSEEYCLRAIKQNLAVFNFFTEQQRTPRIRLAASGEEFLSEPQKARLRDYVRELTPQQRLDAVRENGRALLYFPSEQRTPDVCFAALVSYPLAEKIMSAEDVEGVIQYAQTLSEQECIASVKTNPLIINFLSDEQRNYVAGTSTSSQYDATEQHEEAHLTYFTQKG